MRSTIDQEIADRFDQARRETEQRQQNAAEGSFQDLKALYDEAASHRWIDRRGIRVSTDISDLWVRVSAIERSVDGDEHGLIELDFEGAGLERIGDTVLWSAEESAADAFFRLVGGLKSTPHWPGDEALDVAALLQAIANALHMSIDLHTGKHGNRGIGQIVEVFDENWVVTREGLDCVADPGIHASSNDLNYQSDPVLVHLTEFVLFHGLDEAQFHRAFLDAQRIHRALHMETLKMFGDL